MAETKYTPSTSGYASGTGGWSTGTSTIIQGTTGSLVNYYGIMYFDFDSIRATNAAYYPAQIRVRLKSHVGYARTVRLFIGQGMAKDSFTYGARPSAVSGTSYVEGYCAANGWVEFVITDPTWLSALVSSSTTCLYINRGNDSGSYWEGDGAKHTNVPELYVDWYLRTTACGAPTVCSVNSALSEGDVTLSWSGASGGTNNSISGYEIQCSESYDNYNWGSWSALTTVWTASDSGSISVSPSSIRGVYRRFQVRTLGSAGSGYYSGWKVSSNSVRKNTLPTVPTSFTASPATYNNENVTLAWSGAAAGTSAIHHYTIEHCTSSDGVSWSAWVWIADVVTSSSSGSTVVTPSTVPGTYTKYRISVVDTLGAKSSDYRESNSIYAAITACGAPTACSVSATLAEGSVTLSWSGAVSGAGNTITGYEIQHSDSPDGSTWGNWNALAAINTTATNGSVSVEPSSTRGVYRRFQVRTIGSAGSAYYSPWKVSGNSVRKNTLPTAPASFLASPAIYEGNTITLSWSGAVAGTSPIRQYVIQESTSVDGTIWSAYSTLMTILSDMTSGSYNAMASAVAGTYTRYRISVTDTLGAVSSYVVSGTVKKNSPPTVPVLSAPRDGSATYNLKPRFMITTGIEPDGQTQKACVKIGTGSWQDSVNNADLFSQNGYLGDWIKTVFQAETQTPGSKTVAFRSLDEGLGSSSPEVTRSVTILPSPFGTIIENETMVKAEHIRAIRTSVNTVRNYYGLPATVWSEEVLPGKTTVKNWPYHIQEIRKALEAVVDTINQFDTTSTFNVPEVNWLPLGTGRPRAAVMREIQDLILSL